MLNKYMKTEADEPTQKLSSDASTMVVNKFEIDGVAGDKVAIKKVLQDKRYKNRELEILKVLKNDNVL